MTEANKILSLVNETKASYRRGGLEGNLLNVCSCLFELILLQKLFVFVLMTLCVCSLLEICLPAVSLLLYLFFNMHVECIPG
jgi:hypothetical protein